MRLTYKLVWPDGNTFPSRDVPWLEAAPGLDGAGRIIRPVIRDEKVLIDYGVIIRARNPFAHDAHDSAKRSTGSRVVLFYGCYGYGTLAAVLYSQTKEFREMIADTEEDIECVVACRVHDKTPQAVSVAYFRTQPHGTMYISSSASNGSEPADSC
jgi:hypothetical protein